MQCDPDAGNYISKQRIIRNPIPLCFVVGMAKLLSHQTQVKIIFFILGMSLGAVYLKVTS